MQRSPHVFCQKLSRKAVCGAYIGLKPHSPPQVTTCSERFKFLLLDKRKGAPVCSVKNFRVGQFLRNTRGLLPSLLSQYGIQTDMSERPLHLFDCHRHTNIIARIISSIAMAIHTPTSPQPRTIPK